MRNLTGTRAMRRIRNPTARPLAVTFLFFSLAAVYSIFIKGLQQPPRTEAQSLFTRSGEDCRLVHQAPDKCAFVRNNCHDDEAGLLEYLTLYYCHLGRAQPVAFFILVSWLGLLFTTIGIAASDFFSVNLSTIATVLGLSESLAGVTFLAFGNGSPDVFSTFAAMSSNSGSMAVGELIGAAGFITAVVAGSMALVREFKVSKTLVRDICFFVVAVSFTMGFLADGNIHLWECCLMIAFYLFYVVVVVGWHAYTKRRSSRRAKEAASRGHFYTPVSGAGNEELEPYRDDPDDAGGNPVSTRGRSATTDMNALDQAPRIEIGAPRAEEEEEEDAADRQQHEAAEVTSSMRVNRPRIKRSTSTIAPIRPSLLGALEFRSVLSSLQKEGNVRMRPINLRSHSADRLGHPQGPDVRGSQSAQTGGGWGTSRSRAQSSGALPPTVDTDLLSPRLPVEGRKPHTVGGMLAPPARDSVGNQSAEVKPRAPSQLLHRLDTSVSPPASGGSSPALSPFPDYTDSPDALTPIMQPQQDQAQRLPSLMLPVPSDERRPPFTSLFDHPDPKPVRWWPYQTLPEPHLLLNTLFPTLQGWREKSVWDKFVSLISVPSIFLLVITLPVVESEATDDDPDDGIVDQPATGHPVNRAAPVSFEPSSVEPETEWQRYRRSTMSSRRSSRSPSPAVFGPGPNQIAPNVPYIDVRAADPAPESVQDGSTLPDDDQGWNRWLLILQIFIGPLFCVLVIWANMAEELERPVRTLVRSMLLSLVFSLVLLVILLVTTSPDRRPKYHFLCCFLGFCISIAWISTIAGEVVGVMKAFGVILDISEAILGLTVFAVGNSVGDLVADITMARLGYPIMALSACFGGPLLNILLGIGLGGAYQTIHAANKKHAKHPDRPLHYKPYHIQVSGTLMISAITLLITLLALLIILPMNRWVMNRKIGYGLISLWAASTVLNLAIEMTGLWQEIA
ncbi:hypothetical protein F4780DRAFT_737586 [Xylariomycetidae sp. FL0641]|nr:hypothetical protein F4780DRAFT_737586 [Xylariomycetidae sp. FL0641]